MWNCIWLNVRDMCVARKKSWNWKRELRCCVSILLTCYLYAIRVQQPQCRHEKKYCDAALISFWMCTFIFTWLFPSRFLPDCQWIISTDTPLLYSIHVKTNKWLHFFLVINIDSRDLTVGQIKCQLKNLYWIWLGSICWPISTLVLIKWGHLIHTHTQKKNGYILSVHCYPSFLLK